MAETTETPLAAENIFSDSTPSASPANTTANGSVHSFLFREVEPREPAEVSGWLLGYAFPALVVLVLLANSVVLLVLSRSHMRGAALCIMAVLAVTTTLEGASALPWYVYFYTSGRYKSAEPDVPEAWCTVHLYCAKVLPAIFTSANVWLVVYLALQRLVHTRRYRKRQGARLGRGALVSRGAALLGALFLLLLATGYVLPNYVTTYCARGGPTHVMGLHTPQDTLQRVYGKVFVWVQTLLVYVAPLVLMLVLACVLAPSVAAFRREARRLLVYNQIAEHRKATDGESQNLMTVGLLAVTAVGHAPRTALLVLHILAHTCCPHVFPSDHVADVATLGADLAWYFCFTLHLPVYCLASRKFRITLARSCCRKGSARMDHPIDDIVAGDTSSANGGDKPKYQQLKTYKEVVENETTVL